VKSRKPRTEAKKITRPAGKIKDRMQRVGRAELWYTERESKTGTLAGGKRTGGPSSGAKDETQARRTKARAGLGLAAE
jgi:hypothetical protein